MSASPTLRRLAREGTKEPNLIVEIEGIDKLFSAIPVEKLWRFDEGFEFDTTGLRFDTPYPTDDAIDCIAQEGTSARLSQQITPDKGGTSSVPSLSIALVDVEKQVSNLLFFGNQIDELLGKEASVYITYKGASHPEDSLPILLGYVDEYEVRHGVIIINVSHPENLKRKEIFEEYSNQLTDDIDDVQTSVPVISTTGLFLPTDNFKSYLTIGDEAMEVTAKTGDTFTVVRGSFGTIPEEHEDEADVGFIYELRGQAIDLALKIMLSSEDDLSWGDSQVTSIGLTSPTNLNPRLVFYEGFDIRDKFGFVVGDFIEIENSQEGNDGNYVITGFGTTDTGSFIIVNQELNLEPEEGVTTRFRSKYNVLPFGLGLTGREVDVAGHEDIDRFNPQNFPEYVFYLDSQVNGKEFIDRELYFPVSLFSIPRRAKISCKIIQPPLAQGQIVRLDETNISSIENLRVKRSTHKFFYNTIFYKFNNDPIEQKFTSGAIFRNEISIARIPIGTKQLTVDSLGLRENLATRNLLNRQQQRAFDRYQFAPQVISNVSIFTEVGFDIEVGDIVVIGSENMQLTDLNEASNIFEPRLVEVINKSFNVFTHETVLELLESSYNLDSRYGIISLASMVSEQVSPTELRIRRSFDVGEYEFESDKWSDFIRENIWIRSPDYSEGEVVQLLGVSESDKSILITGVMSVVPQEDWIIEVPEYQFATPLYKDLFVFFNPQAEVTDVISPLVLEVNDISLFFEGSIIYIRSDDFTEDTFSEGLVVDSISGNQITLNKAPSVTIQVGFKIDLIGFSDDEGAPYRIV